MKKWIIGLVVLIAVALAVVYFFEIIDFGQLFPPKTRPTPSNETVQVSENSPEAKLAEAIKKLPDRPSNPVRDKNGRILSIPMNAYPN